MEKVGILVQLEGAETFTKNLRAINSSYKSMKTQIEELSSEFSSFSSKTSRADSVQQMLSDSTVELSKKLGLLKKHYQEVVKKYGEGSSQAAYYRGEMSKVRAELDKVRNAMKPYHQQISQGEQAVKTYNAKLELLNATYEKHTKASEKSKENQKVISAALESQKQVILGLESKLRDYTNRLGENDERTLKVKEDLYNARIELEKLNDEFAKNSSVNLWGKSVAETGKKLKSVGDNISTLGSALTRYVSTGSTALLVAMAKSASDFESAFVGVTKTVQASEEEFAMLKEGIKELSTETASTKEEIASTMEVVGRLGVEVGAGGQNLLNFTKVMIELGDSTDISAENAADALAKFMNVTRLSQDKIENLGSAVVALGNNYAANESEIIELMQRMASAGTVAGLTAQEIAGLSTAIIATGVQAEAGGTSMAQTFKDIDSAVSSFASGSTEALDTISSLAGVTSEEFANTWEGRPMDALKMFFKGLNSVSGNSIELNAVLEKLGMTGLRQSLLVKNLALSFEDVDSAVALANTSFEENTALSTEAGKRYQTFASKLSQLKEEAKNTASEFGEQMLPVLEDLMKVAKKVLKHFSNLSDEQKVGRIRFLAFAAAIGPVVLGIGKLISTTGSAITAIGELTPKIANLASTISTKITGSKLFQTAASGISSFVSSIGGIGVAAPLAVAALGTIAFAVIAYKNSLVGMRAELDKEIAAMKTQYAEYDTSAEKMQIMSSRLDELQAKEHLSSSEKSEMSAIVSELNSNFDGLNLSIDSTTGKVEDYSDATKKAIAAQLEQFKATKKLEKLETIYSDLIDAQMELADAEDAYARKSKEYYRQLKTGAIDVEVYNSLMEDLTNEVEIQKEKVSILSGEMDTVGEKYDAAANAVAGASGALEEYADSSESATYYSEDEEEAVSEAASAYEELKASIQEATASRNEGFASIEYEAVTMQQAQEAINSQIAAYQSYAANIATIQQYIQGLTGAEQVAAQRALEYAAAMGLDGAPYIQAFVDSINSGDGALITLGQSLATAGIESSKFNAILLALQSGSSAAADAVEYDMGRIPESTEVAMEGVASSTESGGTEAKESLTSNFAEMETAVLSTTNNMNMKMIAGLTQIRNTVARYGKQIPTALNLYSSFYTQGQQAVQGLADGIANNIWRATNQAALMAQAVTRTSTVVFQIKSPSRVMKEQGMYLVQGLAEGISGTASVAMSAMKNTAYGIMSTTSGAFGLTNGASTMSINSNTIDTDGIYDAVKSGASNARVVVNLNDRELTRGLKGLGVSFT